VSAGSVLLTGYAIGDVARHDNEGRPALRLLERLDGVRNPLHDPRRRRRAARSSRSPQAPANILVEGQRRLALDGDVIVVVEPAEVVELEMAGHRRGLATDALHHAAVAEDGVGVVIEQFEIGFVVRRRQPLAGDGHADAVGGALAEWPCCRLGAWDETIFGMARRPGCRVGGKRLISFKEMAGRREPSFRSGRS